MSLTEKGPAPVATGGGEARNDQLDGSIGSDKIRHQHDAGRAAITAADDDFGNAIPTSTKFRSDRRPL